MVMEPGALSRRCMLRQDADLVTALEELGDRPHTERSRATNDRDPHQPPS
jgi:hypothetical protein